MKTILLVAALVSGPAFAATVNIDLANAQFESCGALTCRADGYTYDVDGFYAGPGDGVGLSRDSNDSYSIFKDVGTFDAVSFRANFSSAYYQTGGVIRLAETRDAWADPTVPVYDVPEVPLLVEGYLNGAFVTGARVLGSGRNTEIGLGSAFSGIDELRFTLPDAVDTDRAPVLGFATSTGGPLTIGDFPADTAFDPRLEEGYSGLFCEDDNQGYCNTVYLTRATLRSHDAPPVPAAIPLPLSGLMLLAGMGGLASIRLRRTR